jgi:hypothetical protein
MEEAEEGVEGGGEAGAQVGGELGDHIGVLVERRPATTLRAGQHQVELIRGLSRSSL